LVTTKLTLPDADTRAVLLDSTHRYANRSGVAGVVVSGGGFWASAIRGFTTGISVLAPRSLDLRIVGATEDLIPWFPIEHEKRTGIHLDRSEFLRILAQAQAGSAEVIAQTRPG
jgi:hypothetical protein